MLLTQDYTLNLSCWTRYLSDSRFIPFDWVIGLWRPHGCFLLDIHGL